MEGLARLVNLEKAVHQAAIDNSKWHTAALQMDHPDPLQKKTFSGTADEMQDIASYREDMAKLGKLLGNNNPWDPNEDGGGGGGVVIDPKTGKPKGKAKAKGKGGGDEDG